MAFPTHRPRRLRATPALRRLVAETTLRPRQLVLPMFVKEGAAEPTPIASMPGVVQHTRDSLRKAAVDAVAARDAQAAAFAVLAYAGLELAGRCVGVLLNMGYGGVWRRLQRGMARRVYAHVLDLPHAYHLASRTGELSRTITDGIYGIRSVLGALLFGLLPVLLQVAAIGAIFAHSYPPGVLGILLVFTAAYAVTFARGTVRQRAALRVASKADADASGHANDALVNHETVKLFGAEGFINGRIDAALARSETGWRAYYREQGRNGIVLAVLFAAALGAMLLVAVREVAGGGLSPGGFVLVNAYVLQLIAPIERLGSASRELTQGLTYVEQLSRILAEPRERAGGAALPPGDGPVGLQVEDLRFAYHPEQPILRGVSFEVPPGRTVAVVGASGSGKSTLARLLFRLYEPTAGRILIDGAPAGSLDLHALRAAMAIVPQDTPLFHETLAENVLFGRPDATQDEVAAAAAFAGLDPVVAALPDGWDTVVGERGLRLSGGEKQRVAIARAILKRPRLFVLDEATSSLDTHTERFIQDSLVSAVRGTTTLVIAHRLSTVRDADEIIVLDAGVVAERGSHAALLARDGLYAGLWAAQQEGSERVAAEPG